MSKTTVGCPLTTQRGSLDPHTRKSDVSLFLLDSSDVPPRAIPTSETGAVGWGGGNGTVSSAPSARHGPRFVGENRDAFVRVSSRMPFVSSPGFHTRASSEGRQGDGGSVQAGIVLLVLGVERSIENRTDPPNPTPRSYVGWTVSIQGSGRKEEHEERRKGNGRESHAKDTCPMGTVRTRTSRGKGSGNGRTQRRRRNQRSTRTRDSRPRPRRHTGGCLRWEFGSCVAEERFACGAVPPTRSPPFVS